MILWFLVIGHDEKWNGDGAPKVDQLLVEGTQKHKLRELKQRNILNRLLAQILFMKQNLVFVQNESISDRLMNDVYQILKKEKCNGLSDKKFLDDINRLIL